jgi:transposase-like protein
MPEKDSAEKGVREIRRKTRRKFSAEEKIRIVLEGRHHLDVTGPVAANLRVHEANLNFDTTCLSR